MKKGYKKDKKLEGRRIRRIRRSLGRVRYSFDRRKKSNKKEKELEVEEEEEVEG